MRNIFLMLILPFSLFAQTNNETIDSKGNWYFGAEIGSNKISSISIVEPNTSFQGGILAEYYFAKHWSASARIKYFETGVSFSKKGFDGLYLASEGFSGVFNGAVISIPIDLKWEYRIYKNLSSNIKLGLAYNYETKSNYNFSENLATDYPKNFGSLNAGIGLTYFFNKKIAVYIDYENYLFGGYKGNDKGFLWTTSFNTENNLTNFGIKYNFKK